MPAIDASSQLALRPISNQDRGFLYRLYACTREDEMALVNWSNSEKQNFLMMQFQAQSRFYADEFPNASFDVIELDGQPVGRLYADVRDGEIRVIDIAILPEFRGRGIGSHYLQQVIQKAAEKNLNVGIHVERNNPAMNLYQRLGFDKREDKGVYWFMVWCPGSGHENTAS